MNREVLERMSKEELMELVSRQEEVIDSLNQLRYDTSCVIESLVRVPRDMNDMRYHDADRSHYQECLDEWLREMYGKYPMYLVSAEKVDEMPENPCDLSNGAKGQPLKGDTSC